MEYPWVLSSSLGFPKGIIKMGFGGGGFIRPQAKGIGDNDEPTSYLAVAYSVSSVVS
jgi:hypothetical protein